MTELYVISGTNRPEVAKRFASNLLETSQCEIILVANPKIEIFNNLLTYRQSFPPNMRGRIKVYYAPYATGFVQAVNHGWGRLRKEDVGTDKNILAFLSSDDYEFHPGWYEAALSCYKKSFPERDGLMFMRDHCAPANRPKTGLAIVSAKFCDLYLGGWIAPPWYITSGIDTEYVGVAEKHGKCAACPDANIKHLLHDWKRTYESEQRRLAILIMNSRAEHGWPYDIEAPWRHWR